MMKAVLPFEIFIEDAPTLRLPQGSEPFAVALRDGKPYVYVLVNEEGPTIKRRFYMVGTGQVIAEELKTANYLGSFQIGETEFHFFDGGDELKPSRRLRSTTAKSTTAAAPTTH